MSRTRAADGRLCVHNAVGRRPIRAVSLVRQFFSAVSDCIEPLRALAADFASIPSACCTRPTVRAAITISIQAKGERRAPRFNY